MKPNNLIKTVTRSVSMVGFQLKKHSPEILIAGGVVGVVASTVVACKATTKASDILAQTKEELDKVHTVAAMDNVDYTEIDKKKDLTAIYVQTGLKFVKLYAPAVIMGALSLSAILSSHQIMRRRNAALAAAFATVDTAYKKYRERVVERFGEVVDQELVTGVKTIEVEETVVDENGNETTVTTKTTVFDKADFGRCYDDGCRGWTKDPDANLAFLKQQERWANDLLQSRGYVLLNDVYEALGFDKTKAGHVVGWLKNDSNEGSGDGYVSFGIYELDNERNRDFINGLEKSIWLNFNYDGYIYDQIQEF